MTNATDMNANVTFETIKARHYAKIMKEYGLSGRAHSSACMKVEMDEAHRRRLNLHPHHPDRVAEAETIVKETLDEFIRHAELDMKYPLTKNWYCGVRFDWSLTRTRSRGGRYSGRYRSYEMPNSKLKQGPLISLAMGQRVPLGVEWDSNSTFMEYNHIKDDPEIGAFNGTYKTVLQVLVIHEAAHAVQFNSNWGRRPTKGQRNWGKEFPTATRGSHKQLWQEIYRNGRKHFGFVREEDK